MLEIVPVTWINVVWLDIGLEKALAPLNATAEAARNVVGRRIMSSGGEWKRN